MMNHDYIIAIDPDYKKSGVAILDSVSRSLVRAEALAFPDVIKVFAEYKEMNCIVVFENSAFTTNNWHVGYRDTVYKAAALGRSVGLCHATAQHLLEVAEDMHLATDTVVPFHKCWKGPDGKITQGEAAQFMKGLPVRTNQDVRDAALIAWLYAELPIRIKP